jgi:AraC-like DNA-binding protein
MASFALLDSRTTETAMLSPRVRAGAARSPAARPLFPERGGDIRIVAEASRILDDVRLAVERNPHGAHAAALRLVTLLAPPPEAEPPPARGGLAPWQKRKVDRYLRENLERSVRVSELADQVSLSVSHFCRAFKEAFGESPHAYLVRLRLQLAQELMLATQDPLSQIAVASGLADQAHLCKLFRRGVGESPGAWRRRNVTDAQAEARQRRPTVAALAG